MSSILFDNVSIFDGSGAQPFKGQVLVDGRRIVRVAREEAPISALTRGASTAAARS